MEKLPEGLRMLVVERMLPIEDLTNLRLPMAWRDSVDRSFIRNWVQQLLAGKQFAASLCAGLHVVQHHANGNWGFLCAYLQCVFVFCSISMIMYQLGNCAGQCS